MIVVGASNWMQISVGANHTCAINTLGQLFCWGTGTFGRLGLGDNDDENTPARVAGAENWMQVSAGDYNSEGDHTCSIKASEQVWCWGRGGNGQLGLGSSTDMNTPARVPVVPLR